MKWKDSVAPLRETQLPLVLRLPFVNTLGNMMASVALAFAVLEITDSATALGQVLAAHTIPTVVFLLWGGVIADRFPRTLVIQVSNVLAGLTQAAIALLVITGSAEIWMVVVLSVVHGLHLGDVVPRHGQHHAAAGAARPAPAGERLDVAGPRRA